MSSSAKEILNSLESRLLQQEKEFAQKRSALEQSQRSLNAILDRTGWDYSALGSKAGELEQTLKKQKEECLKTEKKLNSVVSYQKRIEKVSGAIEELKKEYEVWKEFERPALESDIEVASQFLEEQAHIEGPSSEESVTRKVPDEVIAKYKEEEEALAKNLEQRKQEIQKEEQALGKDLEEKKREIAQKKKEIEEVEEKLKAEAEKNLLELKAKYKSEEESMLLSLKKKEEELKGKLMAWAQGQKQKLEQKLKAEEAAAQQAIQERLKKQIPSPAAEEKKIEPPRKVATVTTLPIKPAKPALPPRESIDARGGQRVFLADQQIEVKLKGIIETGLLYDLTESELGILVKRGNEAMRPGNTLPGVMFHLPDSGALGGRAEVRDIRPNTDGRYDYRILLTVAAPDLPESQGAELAKFVEKSRLQNFKGRHLKVENDF
ncbi:MAG: hypothetical protein HZA01_07100 [Nitrospinae bacterium]|nr:hypothetical protein [Nitrospinota bacterium]